MKPCRTFRPDATTASEVSSPSPIRLLYDRREAARQLSISVRSLDYLIADKRLNTRRIGKKVLVFHGELVKFSRADHFGAIAGTNVV